MEDLQIMAEIEKEAEKEVEEEMKRETEGIEKIETLGIALTEPSQEEWTQDYEPEPQDYQEEIAEVKEIEEAIPDVYPEEEPEEVNIFGPRADWIDPFSSF